MTSRDKTRKRAVIALLGLAGAAVVGLGNSLTSCAPQSRAAETGQPASAAQIQRLATMRENDWRDGRSGFRATIGGPGSAVHLTGWVDWRKQLLYLSSAGDRSGPADGLVEAGPQLAAVRLGRPAPVSDGSGIVDPFPPPPAVPPTDGWRVRKLTTTGPDASPFDGLLVLLLGLSAGEPDDARALAAAQPKFLRRAMTGGVATDVLVGPATLPGTVTGPARQSSAAPGNGAQVSYWLDDTGRLRRLDALLRKDLGVRVDFNRDDRTEPATIEALGGAPVAPRPATPAEAALLNRMSLRDKAVRGGKVSVTLPYPPAGLLHASGWLDWQASTACLATQDADDPAHSTLVWADRTGVTTRPTPNAPATPPTTLPKGGWQLTTWAQHDRDGATDLDVLLGAALGGTGRAAGTWLRTDAVAGVPVTVFEVQGVRYWVDASGALRRVEVREADGGYGWLDVTPGPVPRLTKPAR